MKNQVRDGSGKKRRQHPAIRAAKYVSVAVITLALMFSLPQTTQAVGKKAKGPDVYVIQGMLKSIGSYAGPIDGYYGPQTVKGVKYYQKMHGLQVTGSVDAKTLQSITYSYSAAKAGTKAQAKWKGKANGKGAGVGAGGAGGGAGGAGGGA
ncbi:peptidoglycan-binding domain-containing protein, partial [Paenibacillus agaridevorans]|uniref:peptidoglycan-binding domain-containing protein n=1 Tax=Paenibacillus agaridevorans TaxID=171404 RepID=UPI002159D4E3